MAVDGRDRWVVNAVAPIRMCDLGGWTDTWFADQGAVLNIGVYPYAEVQVFVWKTPSGRERTIVIDAENFGDRYILNSEKIEYDRHPLIEASIDIMEIPKEYSFEVHLFSEVPAGCSTGTSAAVTVALLGALDMLTTGRRTPHEIAALAHRVETEKLGLQCGIQDQICSAFGGICFIEMPDYPRASVSQIRLPDSTWWELERRLMLVFLGSAHSSSNVHREVIRRLEEEGADKSALVRLREAAHRGKNSLYRGDFEEFGRVMTENTGYQAELHPELVSEDARFVAELASDFGCLGWKVNGAGGNGGSLSLLFGPERQKSRRFVEALHESRPDFRVIPTYLSRMGLRQWLDPEKKTLWEGFNDR